MIDNTEFDSRFSVVRIFLLVNMDRTALGFSYSIKWVPQKPSQGVKEAGT
jgi:hypothetical protein